MAALALLLALALVSQGVVQSFDACQTVPLLQPMTDANGKLARVAKGTTFNIAQATGTYCSRC